MSNHLGVLVCECDAPPYPIVRACRKLGIRSPEDVRWSRMSHHQKQNHGWMSFLAGRAWDRLLGRVQTEQRTCTCGRAVPDMDTFSFTFQTGEQLEYELGQCPRCRTIYWEPVQG